MGNTSLLLVIIFFGLKSKLSKLYIYEIDIIGRIAFFILTFLLLEEE